MRRSCHGGLIRVHRERLNDSGKVILTKAISFGALAGRPAVCVPPRQSFEAASGLRPRVVVTRLVIPTYWLNRIYRRSISLRLTGTGCQVSGTNPFHWIFPEELAVCVCVCVCAHTRACAPLKLPVQCFAFILSRHFEFYESTRRFEAREDRRHFSILFSKRDAIIKQHRTFYFRSKYYKNTRFVFFFFFFREFNGISTQFLISHYLEAFLFF